MLRIKRLRILAVTVVITSGLSAGAWALARQVQNQGSNHMEAVTSWPGIESLAGQPKEKQATAPDFHASAMDHSEESDAHPQIASRAISNDVVDSASAWICCVDHTGCEMQGGTKCPTGSVQVPCPCDPVQPSQAE